MSEWRPVPGYEGYYEVSDDGQVRSIDRVMREGNNLVHRRGRLLKQYWDAKNNRFHLVLSKRGVQVDRKAHRIVAEAFHGACPEGMECCHNDGNPRNNRADNLRWDTRRENQLDRIRHGKHNFGNRTHCSAGHEYTPENTLVIKSGRNIGSRVCRTCSRVWAARHKAKSEAAA